MKGLLSDSQKVRIQKSVSDIERLSEIVPSELVAKIKSFNSLVAVLDACKNPIKNKDFLMALTARLKKDAMTTCYGYSNLQTACLKGASAIQEVIKVCKHGDEADRQFLLKSLNDACVRLVAKKESLCLAEQLQDHSVFSQLNNGTENTSQNNGEPASSGVLVSSYN